MSRAKALGGDALDALLPSTDSSPAKPVAKSAKKNIRTEAPEKPVVRADAPSTDAADEAPPLKRPRKGKVGRPRGANFGEKKGTRWKRSDGVEMRARSIHIPVDVDKRLRRRAADEDKPVGQVIVELLEQQLG